MTFQRAHGTHLIALSIGLALLAGALVASHYFGWHLLVLSGYSTVLLVILAAAVSAWIALRVTKRMHSGEADAVASRLSPKPSRRLSGLPTQRSHHLYQQVLV